jgi:hypothetical protein
MADSSDEKRSLCLACLVVFGWIVLLIFYWVQVGLLVAILVIHMDNVDYVAWFLMFVPAFALIFLFFYANKKSYADNDENIWGVWGVYIVHYVATVATIFATVAKDLTKKHGLGVNALKITLIIKFLHLTESLSCLSLYSPR